MTKYLVDKELLETAAFVLGIECFDAEHDAIRSILAQPEQESEVEQLKAQRDELVVAMMNVKDCIYRSDMVYSIAKKVLSRIEVKP